MVKMVMGERLIPFDRKYINLPREDDDDDESSWRDILMNLLVWFLPRNLLRRKFFDGAAQS